MAAQDVDLAADPDELGESADEDTYARKSLPTD